MSERPSKVPRRVFLKSTLSASMLSSAPMLTTKVYADDRSPSSATLIPQENALTGADDWQLTRVRVDGDGFRSPWIEGYCSKQSVEAGDSIDVMVSCQPSRSFRLELFRMGYYGGKGARLMKTYGPLEAVEQPTPSPGEKNLHECRWKPSLRIDIPADWLSGVYIGRLTTIPQPGESYWQSHVIFVVRDNRPADILFQVSDNTWQAYNRWPNNFSIYTHPSGVQGPWANVSFDRPYAREAQHNGVVDDPRTVGSGEFLPFEFPLAYWLEQHGYDVTYCSNSDMLSPERGLKCKAFISVGHDEYWDIRQFHSVEKLRDEGVNLLFLSGNSVCWVTPFRESTDGIANRIIFRGGPYGGNESHAVTRDKDHGPFPHRGPDEGLLMGARNVRPVNGGGDWIVTQPEHWIFAGTGCKQGDSIPGLVGWEYHGDPPEIDGLQVVGGGTAWQGGVNPQQWTATIYPGPKGNYVFNAATIFWAQGLSAPPGHVLPWSHWSRPHGPDARVQQITHNLLRRAISGMEVQSQFHGVIRMYLRLILALAFTFPAAFALREELSSADFQFPKGYTVELAASSALVSHPMMADFDDQGRLYVAASAGENLPRAELEKRLPNFIRRLEDTNGDGVFDKATTFADRMTFPQGCLWLDGSLYVASSGAIWKLTDTDDDGVADVRKKIVGDFGYTGNAADVHGPFLGPEGRIYWCEGRHGHEIRDADGTLISQGKAARIFSSLPDGSDVQTFATGGMDNPVEVVFTPEGDMLGTVNLMYSQPRGDCLVHWQYGGVYPREDFAESLGREFVRTGPLLLEVHNFGHVAVSGLCRFEGNGWGPTTNGSLFITQFNTNRIVQVRLKPSQSTFQVEKIEDFLVSSDKDFHPTDVLQAPDGSLLVIDTGGWFRIGCPQSGVAKAHIQGGIYRIRRSDAPQESSDDLKTNDVKDIERVWQLRRQASNDSLTELGNLLESDSPRIRQVVARALLDLPPGQARTELTPRLEQISLNGSPAERRNALATLSHWGVSSDAFTRGLLASLPQAKNDPLLQHATILSLIRGGRRDLLRQAVLDQETAVSDSASLALAELQRLSEKLPDSPWLEIPAAPMGEPLTQPQQELLLNIESTLAEGNPQRGREVFFSTQATCSKCHRIADHGGQVGPNLSTIGLSRSRRDLLESIVFPNATFARGFAPYVVATSDGKTHSGIILAEGTDYLRLGIDQEKSVSLPNESIEEIRASNTSIMPNDIQKTLSTEQLSDLLAYLQSLRPEAARQPAL